MRFQHGLAPTLDRRAFLASGAAGAAALGLAGSIAPPGVARADGDDDALENLHPPEPIPGGIQIPDGPLIHTRAPGDPSVTLPFSAVTLEGFDVEPSTLTNFDGFAAVAFHVGSATGADGRTYDLETDVRAYKGAYVDGAGTRRFGTFAFI